MTPDDSDLQSIYQTATRRRNGAECPGEESLMKMARNALPPREREAVVAHLARCSDCARDYRIAKSLAPWADETAGPRRESERTVSPFAIAAAVAIAVSIPLFVWMFLSRTASSRTIDQLYAEIALRDREIRVLRTANVTLREATNQRVAQPQIGTAIVDLDADNLRGAPTASMTTVEITEPARSFTLILHLPFGHASALELRDHAGHLAWRGSVPAGQPSGTITITIPRDLVATGDYVIRATGESGAADFRFRVRACGAA